MTKTAVGRSILIVDDDPDILASFCDVLEDRGFLVDVAASGNTALALVERNRYDVVLLDYKMPDMNGAELYAQIRQRQSVTVAIMITAYAGEDGVRQARNAGTWQVMRKPVDMTKLIGFIESALTQKKVLLVDDDEDFCDSVWDALRLHGVRVGLAHTVEQAKAELELDRYATVLLDLRLGDATSEAVLDELSNAPQAPRVIVVTGADRQDAVVKRVINGVDGICHKPIDIVDLVDLI